jgi:hypothetical protein
MNRDRRWVPLFATLVFLGLAAEVVGMARAEGPDGLRKSVERPKAYQEGPLEPRSAPVTFEWPPSSDEFLALGVLSAILFGFRASGLARRGHAPAERGHVLRQRGHIRGQRGPVGGAATSRRHSAAPPAAPRSPT